MSLAPPVDVSTPTPRDRHQERWDTATARDQISCRNPRAWFCFWVACLAAPLPMLVPYLTGLWHQEHYQFFPLVFVAVAALVFARSDGQTRPPRGWLMAGLIIAGWTCTGISVAIFSPWVGAVGFVAIAAAWLGSMREGSGRSLTVLALPLLTLIRLPLQIDTLLIIRLQGWTTQIASMLLDMVAIPHLVTGNVIELTSRDLFVAEACSGIQSVFTLFFLASLLVAYKRHPLWFIPMHWAAAVVLAVLGNSLRVASVAAGEVMLGLDWATGWSHDCLGYATLLIASLLLLSFDQCVTALLHPLRDVPNYLGLQTNPLVDLWNRCVGDRETEYEDDKAYSEAPTAATVSLPRDRGLWLPFGLSALSLPLVVLSSLSVAYGWGGPAGGKAEEDLTIFFTPPKNMLDGIWDGECVVTHEIARDGEDRRLGKAADIWMVQDRDLSYQVALSQPYIGWHELCLCYGNLDWELADRSVLTSAPTAAPTAAKDSTESGSDQYALARFRRDDGRCGYLLFAAITYEGRGAQPPQGLGIAARLGQRFSDNPYAPQEEMMMLQLWLESPERLRPDHIQRLKQVFDRARIRVLETVRSSPEAVVAAGSNQS